MHVLGVKIQTTESPSKPSIPSECLWTVNFKMTCLLLKDDSPALGNIWF